MWGKKDKHCSSEKPEDKKKGSQWDHIGFEAESKLCVSLVVGSRTKENTERLIKDFAERTDYKLPRLITTDEYKPYRNALLKVYGKKREQKKSGKRSRPYNSGYVAPDGLVYATVHKHRKNGRVVKVEIKEIFGGLEKIAEALKNSSVSSKVNTAFVERFNATMRQHNSRKQRKVYGFSKKFEEHEALSWLSVTYYNFCRRHRGLEKKKGSRCSPAMAAKLSNHIWFLKELFKYPVKQFNIESGH